MPPDDAGAARVFFETEFVPYALVSSDGPDSGLITGYYEPIIDGSRTQSGDNRYPIFGVPEDLIVVDLAAANPECATCGCADAWMAVAWFRTRRAAKSTRAACPRK